MNREMANLTSHCVGPDRPPSLLAKRLPLLHEFQRRMLMTATSRQGPQPWIIPGARCAGKTALLDRFELCALDAEWAVVKTEAIEFFAQCVTGLKHPEDDLADALITLGEEARASDRGALIAIDDLDEASLSDLQILNVALHTIGQEVSPVPVFFVGAGSPALPSTLAEATNYAERLYDFRRLGTLASEGPKSHASARM